MTVKYSKRTLRVRSRVGRDLLTFRNVYYDTTESCMPNTINMVAADMESFKDKCARLGVDYHRALKRREANLSEERIFDKGFIRNSRVTKEVVVNGRTFPNLKEAVRDLNPVASRKTISRLLQKGVSPEEAFAYVPNPGYANGIIYCVTHKPSLKQYVGLTMQTIERRWQYHLEQASSGHIKSGQSLHAAIREHGAGAFEVKQIDRGVTKKGLEEKERAWIQKLNTISPNGFNISVVGLVEDRIKNLPWSMVLDTRVSLRQLKSSRIEGHKHSGC